MVQDNFLYQNVLVPTRGENILDLVLSNREKLVTNLEVGEPLGNSDHNSIRFDIEIANKAKENMGIIPNFRLGNFEGLRERLIEEAWEGISSPVVEENNLPGQVSSGSASGVTLTHGEVSRSDQIGINSARVSINCINLDEEYNYFVQKLKDIQNYFIPKKQFRSSNNDPKWMNSRIKHLIGIKKGLYRRLK